MINTLMLKVNFSKTTDSKKLYLNSKTKYNTWELVKYMFDASSISSYYETQTNSEILLKVTR